MFKFVKLNKEFNTNINFQEIVKKLANELKCNELQDFDGNKIYNHRRNCTVPLSIAIIAGIMDAINYIPKLYYKNTDTGYDEVILVPYRKDGAKALLRKGDDLFFVEEYLGKHETMYSLLTLNFRDAEVIYEKDFSKETVLEAEFIRKIRFWFDSKFSSQLIETGDFKVSSKDLYNEDYKDWIGACIVRRTNIFNMLQVRRFFNNGTSSDFIKDNGIFVNNADIALNIILPEARYMFPREVNAPFEVVDGKLKVTYSNGYVLIDTRESAEHKFVWVPNS